MGFIAARPPGHHALRDRAMGFCLLNNIAVTAAELTARGERVLVVDWDVHHGNGTQSIFWNDPDVLYVSTHQWPLFPGSGAAHEVGGPLARGRHAQRAGAAGRHRRRAAAGARRGGGARSWTDFAPDLGAGLGGLRRAPRRPDRRPGAVGGRLRPPGAHGGAASRPRRGAWRSSSRAATTSTALRASVAATLGALLDAPAPSESPTSGGPGVEHVERAALAHHGALAEHRDADARGDS